MESSLPKTVELSNGLKMPTLGLGCADTGYSQHLVESITNAVMTAGYVHIDTAQIYGVDGKPSSETVVGEGLQECFKQGKKREDVFITTKMWNKNFHDPEAALAESLKKLQLEYVDLFLIHIPNGFDCDPKIPVHVLWPKMEALVDKGMTKSIGVSNFNGQMVRDLLCYARHKPVVNQIELNPQCCQVNLVDFLKDVNVVPVAYTPIARPAANERGDKLAPANWPDLRENPVL